MTVVRTPYSRINGMYFLERTPGQSDAMFLGDGENEFNADTIGLPALYLGKTPSGVPMEKFRAEFLKNEKKAL